MLKNGLVFISLICCLQSQAQTILNRDPEIEKMVLEISRDSLEANVKRLAAFGTRNTLSTQRDPNRGIGAARNWVLANFYRWAKNTDGRMTAYIDTITLQPDQRRVNRPTLLGNSIAILRGTDPKDERMFVIGAHLDSRNSNVMDSIGEAPGANDDASGVAALMECARIMSKRSFPATLVFVAFSGEEQGLLGAHFLSGKAQLNYWKIEAMLNNDMIGCNQSSETNLVNNTRVRIFSEAFGVADTGKAALQIRNLGLENDGPARQLARYTKEIGERYVDHLEGVLVYRNDRFLRGGDHTPFVLRGFAAIRITDLSENYNYQHQDLRTENGIRFGDLTEFMDFEYLRKNTAFNLSTLANLAKSPGKPAEVKMDVKTLTNRTNLHWNAPAHGKVKGYYVMIRETSSPVWQKKIFTPDLKIDIPYSKDHHFFAVQSVSLDGNESLPVIPVPVNN